MPYSMHRIFCATPGDLEDERLAFYEVIGQFNHQAMTHNILFVSVSIVPNMASLAAFQKVLDENVEACRYYVQVLGDAWADSRGNFQRYFEVARKCAADPQLPMKEVVVLSKSMPGKLTAEGVRNLEFSDLESYKEQLRGLLAEWLETLIGQAG
jgi:hypothetical protein